MLRRIALAGLAMTALAAPAQAPAAETILARMGATEAVRAADGSVVAIVGNRLRRIAADGTVTTVAGRAEDGYAGDLGTETDPRFLMPQGLAALPDGGFLVADTFNHRVARIAPDGRTETVFGGGFQGPGCPPTRVGLHQPMKVKRLTDGGMAVLAQSGLYRVWTDGSTARIAVHDPDVYELEQEPAGSLLVSGRWNWVDRIAADGNTTRLFGPIYDDSVFDGMRGIAPMSDGGLLVADHGNDEVRRWWPYGPVNTFVTNLDGPNDVTVDPGRGALIADDTTVRSVSADTATGTPPAPGFGASPTGGTGGACRGTDPSFGGIHVERSVDFPTSHVRPMGLVTEPGGSVVAAVNARRGEQDGLGLVRYDASGRPDSAFGSNAFLYLGYDMIQPGGLARLSSGRYIAAGVSRRPADATNKVTVAAFTPGGQLDTGFAEDGRIELDGDLPSVAVLAGAGDVVTVVASSDNGLLRTRRLTADGQPLAGWETDGTLGFYGMLSGAALQRDGRVIVAGRAGVVRLGNDGRLDPTWDGDGVAFAPPGFETAGVAIQRDGKVLIAGRTRDYYGAVLRLLSDGTPDPSFGTDGLVTVENPALLRDVTVRADGRILAVGGGNSPEGQGPTLLGLLPNGALDPALGEGGRVVSATDTIGSNYTRVVLQPDGRAVAAGAYHDWLILGRYTIGAVPGAEEEPGGGESNSDSANDGDGDGDGDGANDSETGGDRQNSSDRVGDPAPPPTAPAAGLGLGGPLARAVAPRSAAASQRDVVLQVVRVPTLRAFRSGGLKLTLRGEGLTRVRLVTRGRTVAGAIRRLVSGRPVTITLRPTRAWRRSMRRLTLVATAPGQRTVRRSLTLR